MKKTASEHSIDRRAFLKQAGAGVASVTILGGLLPILEACSSSTGPSTSHGTVTVDVSSLTANGSAMHSSKATPEGQPLIIIRDTATTFTVLSSYCPHEGCAVSLPQNGSMLCPCHNSVFDAQGNFRSGPAGRSLSKYTSTYDATTRMLTITY